MEPTKVLVVDDSPETITELTHLIESHDLLVVNAKSGLEALSLLLEHDFALALLDVQLPDMNGIELARLMRGANRSRSIPIIFVTATASSKEIIFEGYEEGAVDFLVKPLEPHIVRSKIRVFVELDQQKKILRKKIRQLDKLKSEAVKNSQAKSQFLANVSHEIRTPLGAILGFAEMLSDNLNPNDENLQFVDAILRNGQLLKQLIDDILDISKIEAGRLTVEKRQTDFSIIMDDIKQTFLPITKGKNLELLFRNSTRVPKLIETDPVRLKQILINIIGNSIKFTTIGHVVVECGFTSNKDEGKDLLSITITDTGCGIPEEKRDKLFKPFVQADASTTRLYGGTGLGLSISRYLARCLGGDVQLVTSITGSGSIFRITIEPGSFKFEDQIPLTRKPTQTISNALRDAPGSRLKGLKILVVDDVADNLVLMHRLLTFTGAQVTCADSGEKCIEIIKNEDVDAILMDIQMPGLDGHTTTRRIRSLGVKTPVIAVTAHTLEEHRIQSFKSGCDDHLTKPVDYLNLIKTVSFHIRMQTGIDSKSVGNSSR